MAFCSTRLNRLTSTASSSFSRAYHKPVKYAVRSARLGEPSRVDCPGQLLRQFVERGEEEGESRD